MRSVVEIGSGRVVVALEMLEVDATGAMTTEGIVGLPDELCK